MKIVYLVANTTFVAGGLRVIIEHVNGLAGLGHEVEIWQAEKGIPYFKTDVSIRTYDPEKLDSPDVLVLTDPVFVTDARHIRSKRKRTFLLIQHDFEWLSKATDYYKHVTWYADNEDYFDDGTCKILVVSQWLRDLLHEKYSAKSFLVRNGVSKELFHEAEPMIKTKRPVVLLQYEPQNWKGFHDAISAILGIGRPEVQVAMFGRSYPLTPYENGQYFGFSFSSVFFCLPEQSELSSIYCSATIFVSSSWKEGFGLPGLEAMACGVPLITTDSGGINDYAIHDQTAKVVPPRDPVALAEAITNLLDDKAERDRLAQNGLLKAKEFSWSKSIGDLEHILKG